LLGGRVQKATNAVTHWAKYTTKDFIQSL
jgi:hypothetical protein